MFNTGLMTIVPVAVALATIAAISGPQAADPSQVQPSAAELFLRKAPDGSTDTRHLTLTTSVSPASATPGAPVTLFVDIAPKPKMHVYAPEQKDVIPVTLVVTPDESIRIGARRFPPSEAYFFAPLKETQRVYSKPFRIAQDVRVADTPGVRKRARGGAPLTISGTVRYQACDETICYLPQEVPVTWRIALAPPPA